MRLPDSRTAAGAAGLAAMIADPARALVAFDFDGTLAPIVERPEDARPADGAVDALALLSGVVGTVAIITGRPAETAVELGGLAGHPELRRLTVLGHYGFERWSGDSGEVTRPPVPEGVAAARAELADVLEGAGAPVGTHVEDKHASLAVHLRRTADPQAAFDLLVEPLRELASRHGLAVEPGRMVIELRPPGMDKGAALRTLATEREVRAVVFAGDDLGDLAAYDAIDVLRHEGVPGVAVCSSSQEVDELAKRADLVVDGPAGVVELIRELAAAIGTG